MRRYESGIAHVIFKSTVNDMACTDGGTNLRRLITRGLVYRVTLVNFFATWPTGLGVGLSHAAADPSTPVPQWRVFAGGKGNSFGVGSRPAICYSRGRLPSPVMAMFTLSIPATTGSSL
jgi:hypothetical protein